LSWKFLRVFLSSSIVWSLRILVLFVRLLNMPLRIMLRVRINSRGYSTASIGWSTKACISQLIIQAIRQASQIAKSFMERKKKGLVSKPYPEVRSISIRFVETTWNYEEFVKSIAPVRIAISLLGGRREVWLRPHKRLWLYWWRVLNGEARLAR